MVCEPDGHWSMWIMRHALNLDYDSLINYGDCVVTLNVGHKPKTNDGLIFGRKETGISGPLL